jgi:CarD family transcriptional regulator, regulator of rRNA transcription
MLLDKEKGLSTGERKMLNDAKQMLISEMVLVCDYTVEEAEEVVEKAVDTVVESDEEEEEDDETVEEDK